MRTAVLLVAGSFLFSTGCGGPEPPPFKPVADVKQLMQSVVDPAADGVWESVSTILDVRGVTEIRPKTDEEWAAVRNSAITVMEAGNLLMMVPRAKDGDRWMQRSRALVDAGEIAVRAAEAKNPDRVFEAGGELYAACATCHQQYWNP